MSDTTKTRHRGRPMTMKTAEAIKLGRTGMHPSDVAAAMKATFPDVTQNQVSIIFSLSRRKGFDIVKHKRGPKGAWRHKHPPVSADQVVYQ